MFGETAYKRLNQVSIFLNEYILIRNKFTEENPGFYEGQAPFLACLFLLVYAPFIWSIPILPEKDLIAESYDDLAYPRNTYDECTYINDELLKAASVLPLLISTRNSSSNSWSCTCIAC